MSQVADDFNEDELVDMPIELPNSVWLELAFQAHKLDITLNQHLTDIFVAAAAAVNKSY